MKAIGSEGLGFQEVLELRAFQASLAGSSTNTVRLWDERGAIAADELFVSVDRSTDVAYVVDGDRGALRWAEIARSGPELLVSIGAHAQIDFGQRDIGVVGELVAS